MKSSSKFFPDENEQDKLLQKSTSLERNSSITNYKYKDGK